MSKLALYGGKPIRKRPFPQWPMFTDKEKKGLLKVLESRTWGGYHPKVSEFEERFAIYHHARFGITTVNGTESLVAALKCCGVGAGNEVIVPPISFISTASAVLLANAIPVFADVEPDTYNINPDCIEQAITSRTRAIIPVHFAGQPSNMDRIMDSAAKHNLHVIEDAAHAHGAEWNNKKIGGFGDFGSFSFQNTKLLTCGEGGALITNNSDLAAAARSYCNQGRKKECGWFEHFTLGTNSRMTGFQAVVLLEQLKQLEKQNKKRNTNIAYLSKKLRAIGGLEPLTIRQEVNFETHYYLVCKYDQEKFNGMSKDKFFDAIESEGIPRPGFYPFPLNRNPLFINPALSKPGAPLSFVKPSQRQNYHNLRLPVSEQACREGLWWMHETFLGTKEDMDDIARAVEKIKECTEKKN